MKKETATKVINNYISIKHLPKEVQEKMTFIGTNVVTGVTLTPTQVFCHCIDMVHEKLSACIEDFNEWKQEQQEKKEPIKLAAPTNKKMVN